MHPEIPKFLYYNTDVTFHPDLSFVGLGAATWDAGGLLIAALAQVHHGSFPTEGGELWDWCCYAG